MRTLSTVIFLSPGTDLSPITTIKYPKFAIPLLNEPLFLHNLRWVAPVSDEIYIIFLEKFKKLVLEILEKFEYNGKIHFIEKSNFDGTFPTLKKIVKNIQNSNILVTKGDIITSIKLESIYNIFLQKKTNFFSVLKKDEANLSIMGYHKDELLFYSDDPNDTLSKQFFFDHSRCTFSKEYDTSQVYIMKRKYLESIEGEFFSLKSNLFPYLIDVLRLNIPVRFFYSADDFFQVQKYSDLVSAIHFLRDKTKNLPFYLFNSELEEKDDIIRENQIRNYNLQNVNFIFKSKKRISFADDKNIVGRFTEIENSFLKKSVIGNNCVIGDQTTIENSILFNNVVIGRNCRIKKCLIGNNVHILDNSILKECKVTGDYKFEESVNVSMKVFIGENQILSSKQEKDEK